MDYKLETLKVYNQAEIFSDKIWLIVQTWDHFKKDTIGKQLTRAADSISANIAEGYGRYFYKESKQFYFFARGSIQETKSWLSKCQRRKIVAEAECHALLEEAGVLLYKLNAYIKFIANSQRKGEKDQKPKPDRPKPSTDYDPLT